MNELIVDKYLKLPKEVQAQVLDYIEFLITKHQGELNQAKPRKSKSNFGSSKGLIEE